MWQIVKRFAGTFRRAQTLKLGGVSVQVEFESKSNECKVGESSHAMMIILFLENYMGIMESVISILLVILTSSKFIHMIPSLTKSIYRLSILV